MTNTPKSEKTVAVAKEIGVGLAKATAQTAVETAAAFTLLLAVGYTISKVQEHKAKKAAKKQA